MNRTQLIIKSAVKFSNLSNAQKFALGIKGYSHKVIIMGDDSKYWALPVSQAMYLNKRGYEIA